MKQLQALIVSMAIVLLLVLAGMLLGWMSGVQSDLENTRLQATAAAAELGQLQATLEFTRQQVDPAYQPNTWENKLPVFITIGAFVSVCMIMVALYWYRSLPEEKVLRDIQTLTRMHEQEIRFMQYDKQEDNPFQPK
ncbi:MAG TPA: hypothetical protein PLQ56_03925 [Aggregatilineales bacterium]|nr:hypothetical protein [Aggregatilineales bacterium]